MHIANSTIPAPRQPIAAAVGRVHSCDGWVIRQVSADLLKHAYGHAASLIAVTFL